MLVKLLVSGVVVLALFRESECCLSNEYINRRNILIHRYASHFVECPCNGDMAKLQYLKWAGPNKEAIPEEGPGTDKNVYAERVEDGLTLLIKNFTSELAGEYHCSAMYDGIYYIKTFQLKLYPHLQFVNTDQQQYLIKGRTSKIICEESSDDKIMTLWHLLSKNYAQISDNEKYKIETNGLVIKNVQDDDAGVYQCSSVATETGDTNAINITVDVISLPVITDLKVTPSKTVVAGDFLKIECKASGEPRPNYVWNKIINGKPMVLPLVDDNSTSWYQENDTLTFEAIKPEERGTYRCTASNMGDAVTKEVTIEVLETPEVIQFDNVTAVEGTNAEIVCRVKGRPIPKVYIVFEEIGYDSDKRISHSTNETSETELSFSLIFSPVGRTHHGFYTCQAVNDVDSVNETMLLNVLFKPVFEKPVESVWGWKGQIIDLNCFYESNPEGNITWRYHGEQSTFKSLPHRFPHEPVARVMLGEIPMYGMYTCTVMNKIGSSTKIIHLKEARPPGPLMNVVAKSKSATSVVFDIASPSDVGGPPILAYTAEYDEADKYNTTHIHYNRTWDVYRQYKVDGLRPNTTYYFRFAAINQVGAGSWSDVLELATEEKSAPEEPMWEDNIADVYDNVNNVILSWKRPESNGQPIDYYEIKYCEDEGDDDVPSRCYSDKTDDNKIMLQNLKANTSYHIMLYAHNAVGYSPVAEKYIKTSDNASNQSLSASNIIGISVCVVVICLVLVDLMLCCWKDQGIIASVCCRKRKQKQNAKEKAKTIRDKKGLLSDGEGAPDGAVRPENNGHKEFIYEKNTGAVTGKHSVV